LKEEMIQMEGTVAEVLPNTQFRVQLTNGAEVLAYAGGKVRRDVAVRRDARPHQFPSPRHAGPGAQPAAQGALQAEALSRRISDVTR
jgi:hypothetical protein